jgi:SAM-dependent methyltransferase
MHLNSELLFKKYAIEYFRPRSKVLEIGPSEFPTSYEKIVGDNSIEWHTLDMYESPSLTYTATSEYSYPIPDGTYDIILSGQVMEHVRKPWVWIRELVRVCKTAGLVITIVPASWPYHDAPHVVDCWRAFPEGMNALYEDAGLITLFSHFDALELQGFKRSIPGRSWQWQGRMWQVSRILGRFGYPVEQAFDTIAVGRKPS